MSASDHLTPAELREALSISTATYNRWLRAGKLRGVKVGGRWRFAQSVVDEILGRGRPSLSDREPDVLEAKRILVERLRDRGRPDEVIEALCGSSAHTDEAIARLIVEHALSRSASDVHVEPVADGLGIRERIDGVLTRVDPPLPAGAARDVASALKRLAAMDPELQDAPQEGRFFAEHEGRKIDVRACTYPTGLGESLTLRLLDPAAVRVRLSDAAFTAAVGEGLRRAIACTDGVFLVNGPTGCGKTTTLYCLLNELKRPGLKLMSIEDPVEIHIDGVLQANVTSSMGFKRGIRAMLVNDVDIGLVGEIRDAETARLLFQAGSTGHLMLSALHAPDAVAAIRRLLELGAVHPRVVAESLRGVLDQRLLPMSCPHCRTPRRVEREDADRLRVRGNLRRRRMSYNEGCESCNGTGVRGRTVVAELVVPGPELRSAIEAGATGREELLAALPDDHRTLLDDVHEKLADGSVSPAAAALLGL
jgi:excisionase family DNA binding protein